MELIAQLIGIAGMAVNVSSFQFKSKKLVLLAQMIAGGLFSVNMFMLGALMGGLLSAIAVVRAAVYMYADRLPWDKKYTNAGFIVLYAISYILVFTVFGKAITVANLAVELLPLIGAGFMVIGFSKTDARQIRLCGLVNSPCWLIYNCINWSIGGILCEIFSLISIISAYLRLDAKKVG